MIGYVKLALNPLGATLSILRFDFLLLVGFKDLNEYEFLNIILRSMTMRMIIRVSVTILCIGTLVYKNETFLESLLNECFKVIMISHKIVILP